MKQTAVLRMVGLALAVALSAWAQAPQDGDGAAGPHHSQAGFHNNYIAKVDQSFSDFLRWRSARAAGWRRAAGRVGQR